MSHFVASTSKVRVPVMLPGRTQPVDEKVVPGPPGHAVPRRTTLAVCGLDVIGMFHFPGVTFDQLDASQQCPACLVRLLVHQAQQAEPRRADAGT